MTIVVLAFARIREILGAARIEREIVDGGAAADLWHALASEFPALADLQRSTRLARGGAFIDVATSLRDGDEIALLPPFGGG